MKKTMLLAFASFTLNFFSKAQYTSLTAERFRSLVNAEHPEWSGKINYSTINKPTMKKTIIMTTLISAVMAVNAQTNKADEQAIRNIVTTIQKGWNEKSGETFSSVFADVHDYIVVNGYYFPGFTRQGNAAAHQSLFNGVYKNHTIRLKVDKINFIRPDLAMINILGAGHDKDSTAPADPTIIMTVLAEKKSDNWKIISFHNHSMEPFDKNRMPMPLEVMYASWYK